jgi:hypothetical protein
MATSKKKPPKGGSETPAAPKRRTGSAGSGAGRRKDSPEVRLATGLNYLIVGDDGTMYLRSGVNGAIRPLTPAELEAVGPLLQQRQEAAQAITDLLNSANFLLLSAGTIDIPPG